MTTLKLLSDTFRKRLATLNLTQESVRGKIGVSRRTLTNVLSGTSDYKVTTLLATAEQLGLDVVLIPKEAAQAMRAPLTPKTPTVPSVVQTALDRIKPRQ
jgi:transcriptional regulator with XRE-family HTH domain